MPQNMFLALAITSALLQGLIALFVLSNNSKSKTNVFFVFLSFTLIAWTSLTFVNNQNIQSANALTLVRLTMFFVVLQNAFYYFFSRTFPDIKLKISKKWAIFYIALTAIVSISALTPLLFMSVAKQGVALNPIPGPAIPLFIIHAFISVAGGLKNIGKTLKNAKDKLSRTQAKLVLFALLILGLVFPIMNFALTLAFQTTIFTNTTPIFAIIFSGLIAYSIVSRKLFDIRAAVTRSVGYILFLAATATIYSLFLFGIINVLLPGNNHQSQREIFAVILVPIFILSFQNLKKYTDRLTNKLFYRESYEIQDVLDSLGEVVVDEIDLHKIIKGTKTVLSSALKPNFIEFILFRENRPYLEAHNHWRSSIKTETLTNCLKDARIELLVADELSESNDTKHMLKEYAVALTLKLTTRDQIVGYILFGNKNSGDSYYSKDKDLLELVANELAITIQNALRFEEIQRFNLTLQYKVEEATHKLRNANVKLKELDETKDEFISMASHQLRTPLTSIKGYISMVLEGDGGKINEMQKKLLDQAFVSSERMVFLISDLLNVSRLRTGKFVIEAKPTNLVQVIEGELHQLTEMGKSKNIDLIFNKPEKFPDLMLDENKIRQVIMNFADNAIYYTPNGGKITLDLKDEGDGISFTVTDTGIGVPKNEQHHLFSKFYRAGNARKARPDGTGLGLFMAKKVIDAQKGEIIFHSEEGKGSTFGFRFEKNKLKVKENDQLPAAQTTTSN